MKFRRRLPKRMFIPPSVSVEEFFLSLRDKNIRYVVLRWFEDLPEIEKGEDIDILFDEKDEEALRSLLCRNRKGQPVDIYSVSGAKGSSWNKMAYYPPNLAVKLLDEFVWHKEIFRVPNPANSFKSLAYHALYHKAEYSCLPSSQFKQLKKMPEHSYPDILKSMALKNGLDIEITWESLHSYLESEGWAPPVDTFFKLAEKSQWMTCFVENLESEISIPSNIAVFVVRSKAFELGIEDEVTQLMCNEGFDLLEAKDLVVEEDRKRLANLTRGGNWNQSLGENSGGVPMRILAVVDLCPKPPSDGDKVKYPHVQNKRLLGKGKVRKFLTKKYNLHGKTNLIHSTDNVVETNYYLDTFFDKDTKEKILKKAGQLEAEFFKNPYPVVGRLSNHGKRAKVELIDFNGRKAVKKTYRPAFKSFFKNEVEAMQEFSRLGYDFVPEFLDIAENYHVTPYYPSEYEIKNMDGRLLPLSVCRKLSKIFKSMWAEGYAMIDCHLDNFRIDGDGNIKIIDLEFCYKYPEKPSSIFQHYDISGYDPVESFPAINAPLRIRSPKYRERWKKNLGMSKVTLFSNLKLLQLTERFLYRILYRKIG